MIDRDFRMVPIEDVEKDLTSGKVMRFGDFLTKKQFELIKSDIDWFRAVYDAPERNIGLNYYIVKGVRISEDIINVFKDKKNVTMLPILIEKKETEYKNKLSDFAKECSFMVTGTVFKCVRDWLRESGRMLEYKVDEYLKDHKNELHQTLIKATNDIEFLVKGLTKQIISLESNLTPITLQEELIDDIYKFEFKDGEIKNYEDDLRHNLEVYVNGIILSYRAGLDEDRMLQLGTSILLHDIGKIVFHQKIEEAILNKEISLLPLENYDGRLKHYINKIFSLHPLYGTALLSKKDGEPIEGLGRSIRYNILEHEQFIDGTGSSVFQKDYGDLLKKMGISEKNTFHGYNHLSTNPIEEEQYPLIQGNEYSIRMTMAAQILNIVENYVTKKNKKGGKETIKEMISYSGKKYNGPIFDKFFFSVIPEKDVPDILLNLDQTFPKHQGSQVLIREINGSKEFYIIKDKKSIPVSLSDIKGKLKLGDY